MIHEKDCWSDPLSSSAGEGGYHLKAAPVAGSSTYELDACPVRPGRMKFHMDFEREYKTLDRSHLQSLSFTPFFLSSPWKYHEQRCVKLNICVYFCA
jgi:hypothetical protein